MAASPSVNPSPTPIREAVFRFGQRHTYFHPPKKISKLFEIWSVYCFRRTEIEMNATPKLGAQASSRSGLKHILAAALLALLLLQGGATAAGSPADLSVTSVLLSFSNGVRGVIDAGAGFVRDLHRLYQITRLRDVRAENKISPAPARRDGSSSARAASLELCKAKVAPPPPARLGGDKSRS